MTLKLIQQVDEIDHLWVRAALAKSYPDVPEILGLEYHPIGNGTASDTYKLTLNYSGQPNGAPETVVLKMHTSDPNIAQAAADSGTYRCEYEMTRVLPTVSDLRAPIFYHSDISEDDTRTVILMQDLSPICEPGDQIKGASSAQAMSAVRELSKVHKHFWNSPKLDTFKWATDRYVFHHQGLPNIKERLGEKLSPEELKIIDDSMPHIDTWLETKPTHHTLTHTDCRADNILFDMSNQDAPNAYIIDWASCKIGDPMADITYLFSSSVEIEERPAAEARAIALFANEIAQVDPSYTIQNAENDYRKNITSSMFLTLVAAAFIPQTDHNDLLLETLIHRNCAAHKDWLFS